MEDRHPNPVPHGLCNLKPVSECGDCELKEHLTCHSSLKEPCAFMTYALSLLAFVSVGMVLGGYGWFVLGEIAFLLFFFNFWGIRVQCSHCPHYAKKGFNLKCVSNIGALKIWKYRPGPIGKAEKIQYMTGTALFVLYPLVFLILGKQWVFIALGFVGLVGGFWLLGKYSCSRCINFSCMSNAVPKEIADKYIQRNPILKKAWEDTGWKAGE